MGMSWELVCGGALVLGGVVAGIALAQIWQNKTVRAIAALIALVCGSWFIVNNYERVILVWEQANRLASLVGGLR